MKDIIAGIIAAAVSLTICIYGLLAVENGIDEELNRPAPIVWHSYSED